MTDRIIAWASVIGLLALAGIGLWEHGHATGYKAGATEQPAPIVIYRRSVDTLSPVELRRLATARERSARIR